MTSEPTNQQGINRSALQSFYLPPPDNVPPEARKLLEEYSKIPADQVLPHVLEVREQAWKVFPYPCIGQFRFLGLGLNLQPAYPEILDRLKSGQKLLDIGCCVAQEIRQLVLDGVPASNLYASDLHPEFLSIGYDLFKDSETLTSTIFAADIFDAKEPKFVKLEGKIDIIWASSFLHLFSYQATLEVLKQLIKLFKPVPGSLFVGKQMGNTTAGEFTIHGSTSQTPGQTESTMASRSSATPDKAGSVEGNATTTLYRHNAASFKKLWADAGELTGSKWDVWVEETVFPSVGPGIPGGSLSLKFSARRI